MIELDKVRKNIDSIDDKMAELFEKRMDEVKKVAEYKKTHGIKVEDLSREEAMIRHNAEKIKNSEYASYYVNYLRSNIEISKQYQHKLLNGMAVAYNGVTGAFAEIVAEKIFPDATLKGYGDFFDAYSSVVSGICDAAVLPLENSYNGDVDKVLDIAFFGPLFVNAVFEADIIQNLIAKKGATLDSIKTVISHPQALGQCSEFIKKHNYETVTCESTSLAVSKVKELDGFSTAAIASKEAGEKFGLVTIESHINKSSNNSTRFAVFSRTLRKDNNNKNFIVFFTVKNESGALSKAINVVAKYNFNLRALKSRPTKELSWEYYFYAEIEGDIYSDKGQSMIKELKQCCSDFKVLGAFERQAKI